MPRRLTEQLIHLTRRTFEDPVRGLRISLLALGLIIMLGTGVYMALEGMIFINALYMTVITISTVGFGEVQSLSEAGRLFTILLILLGVGAATGVISNSIGILAGPKLWIGFRRRTMEHYLMDEIENHFIVCGYGRMGQQVVEDLAAAGHRFVVIDLTLDEEDLLERGINFVVGDATHDETLRHAGVARARGLVAALNTDAGNVMAVLSAREMNPKIFIVARVGSAEAEGKLRRAGANRVVSPYQIGGHRLALALTRPVVNDFLDRVYSFADDIDVDIGQIVVTAESPLAGKTVRDSTLHEQHHVSILAMHRPSGETLLTPPPDTVIEAKAILIVIGAPDAVAALEKAHNAEEDSADKP
jgi:voltage-gated potassium channel